MTASKNTNWMLILVVTFMWLPALLVAWLLWQVFSDQIEASYEKRLVSSLGVLQLAIEHGAIDFRSALTRLAADNTIRVTMDLDIRPQLERYLTSQFEISEYHHLWVVDPAGQVIVEIGDKSQPPFDCRVSDQQPLESLRFQQDLLILNRSVPVMDGQRSLGFLCAGWALNGESSVEQVIDKLDGLALIGHDGRLVSYSGPITHLDMQPRPQLGELFEYFEQGMPFLGLSVNMTLGQHPLQLTALVDTLESGEVLLRAWWITGFVISAILLSALFGVRMLRMRQRAETELEVEREKAVVTLASIADGVVTVDAEGYVTYANSTAKQLLKTEDASLIGNHWRDSFSIQNELTGEPVFDLGTDMPVAQGSDITDPVLVDRQGNKTAVHFSLAPIHRQQVYQGAVLTFRDMRRERELRQRLAWKASRDDLTGLYNRSEFRRALYSVVTGIEDDQVHHCLLYIDLDEFKTVNDTCGHKAGDDLLRKVSGSLRSQLRDSDIIARLGGDEFGVVLLNCPKARGIELAQKLIDTINDGRFAYGDKVFHIGASIGMVSVTHLTTNLEDLLATVDAACYVAKESGRNRVYLGEVDPHQISQRIEELNQASRIRLALKQDRLMLYQQAIVAVSSSENPNHAEILVRMVDEKGQLVAPGAFIPIAERHGFMQDIDRWIIRHLFALEGERLRAWQQQDSAGRDLHFMYSINLSGASLTDPSFADFIKEQFELHGIPPSAIAFEITETRVITHLDKAVKLINALREEGCSFLLDDFGSGMSSFGYLKNLPVDYLKIDGQFVKDILSDPIDHSMVKMINEIGHFMGLKTIAEYVENAAILKEIDAIGIDYAQGYEIAMPKPMEQPPVIAETQTA